MTHHSDRMHDTTPYAGDTDYVSPPWSFPAEHARMIWVAGDERRSGVMAKHAWTAAIRWVLQHPDAAAWVDAAKTPVHEIGGHS